MIDIFKDLGASMKGTKSVSSFLNDEDLRNLLRKSFDRIVAFF